jgi:hypothetical protein
VPVDPEVLVVASELVLPVDKHLIDLHALDVLAMQTLESRLFVDCLDSLAEYDKW